MASSGYGGFDQLSSALAETFRPYVDDNVFGSNMVFQEGWDEAEKVDPGRFLALPIVSGKNQTAQAFGAFDEVNSSPQSTNSVAAFPWSFYQVAVTMDYQTLTLNRGPNVRINLIAEQLQIGIASISDVCGQDLCQFGAATFGSKAGATPNGVPLFGIVEATDDGTVDNVYGNIARTGAGSFVNWQGNDIRKLTTANIGLAANDAPLSLFYALYNNSTQGTAVPTHVFSSRQGVAAYMFALQPQQRLSPGDIANAGFAGAYLFAARVLGDDHILNPISTGSATGAIGCNFFAINMNHTRFFYPAQKGFDFIPWVEAQSRVARTSRYVTGLQFCSSQPRTGGLLTNVNSTSNL